MPVQVKRKLAVGLLVGGEVRVEEQLAFGPEFREVGHLAPADEPVAVGERLQVALAFGDQPRAVGELADERRLAGLRFEPQHEAA